MRQSAVHSHEILESIDLSHIYLNKYLYTVSYDEIKQKVITQANDYHRVKAYTP